MIVSLKERVIRYILIALIIGFFAIPLASLCWMDYKFFPAKRIASLLLFFLR
jgi:hypothetical protein